MIYGKYVFSVVTAFIVFIVAMLGMSFAHDLFVLLEMYATGSFFVEPIKNAISIYLSTGLVYLLFGFFLSKKFGVFGGFNLGVIISSIMLWVFIEVTDGVRISYLEYLLYPGFEFLFRLSVYSNMLIFFAVAMFINYLPEPKK